MTGKLVDTEATIDTALREKAEVKATTEELKKIFNTTLEEAKSDAKNSLVTTEASLKNATTLANKNFKIGQN